VGQTKPPFVVRFWGVRGSIAAPGPTTTRYGGETTCMEVRVGDRVIVIDCGSGIRHLGVALANEHIHEVDLLVTHTHLDHICGLPFFCRAYDPKTLIRFWSGHLAPGAGSLEEVLMRVMSPPVFPLSVHELQGVEYRGFEAGGPVPLGDDISVETMLLNHPGGAMAYRITSAGRTFCSVTDHEHGNAEIDAKLERFVRGADVMVYDSMFTEEEYAEHVGWGHSTWLRCVELALAADVRVPVIFHHDPDRSDDDLDKMGEAARARHPGAVVAHEGLEFQL